MRLGDASYDVGASLGVPAMTAHRALTVHEDGPVGSRPGALEGRIVLVTGGAGAVGHAAIQLAVWAGATVVTTVSSDEKATLARAAGAHHVVNYRTGDAARRDQGDRARRGRPRRRGRDHPRTRSWCRRCSRPVARSSIYANTGGTDVTLPVRPLMALNARLQFILLYTVGDEALTAAAEDVSAAVADGALGVGEEYGLPLLRFPLEQTAAAHDAVENGAVGKVLIDVADLD